MTLTADVQAASQGSEEAFARIVAECANTVCSISLAIVRDVAASEDVAQETFLAAWRGIRNLRNADSFLPWLRQIARNQAHLWLRNHRNEVADDAAVAAAVDSRQRPDAALIDHEQRRILREAIDDLPDETRETLVLYYREGSSARHVAELLGISEEAVRQRLSRARVTLREETLRRFGEVVAKSAPGAAFVAVVAGSLTTAAPTASAAIASGAAAKSGGAAFAVMTKAVSAGALAGAAGVLLSRLHLGEPFDEQERIDLQRFTKRALLIVFIASIAFAFVGYLHEAPPRWWSVAVVLVFVGIIGYEYYVRLPRILVRRLEWERRMIPEIAQQRPRQQAYAAVAQTAGAALGGLTLMLFVTLLHC